MIQIWNNYTCPIKLNEDEILNGLYSKLSELGFETSGDDIKWNFTKFLVDKNGNVVERFVPTV